MTPLLDSAEATVQLYALHQAMTQALREERWEDAAYTSMRIVDLHVKLQAFLRVQRDNRIAQR